MENNQSRVYNRTRHNFMNAFWQLYEVRDIGSIRVQEICDIAGYHRNSFYRYFSDIYDVLENIENDIIAAILDQTDTGILFDNTQMTTGRFLAVWETYSRYLRIFADENKNSRFRIKLITALKQTHRNLFQYSSNSVLDDYIWEYTITGSVSTMLYYYRRETPGMTLQELLDLQLQFRDANVFPLKIRQK